MTKFKENLRKSHPLLYKIAEINYGMLKGYYPILLDYPVSPNPRYGFGKAPHSKLYEIINRYRTEYKNTLKEILELKDYVLKIPVKRPNQPSMPYWMNRWISVPDAYTLYSFLCLNNSKRFFEIGSGNSTKFAKHAIINQKLKTKIISVDPSPRAEINSICDTIMRCPVENLDLNIFDKLETNDILFIDSTHRIFTNSDVSAIFLDILPRLSVGIWVHFHDIYLPYDYPPQYSGHYFSEQYLLAVSLLANNSKFDVILPIFFINNDPILNDELSPIFDNPEMSIFKKSIWSIGSSFWIKTK